MGLVVSGASYGSLNLEIGTCGINGVGGQLRLPKPALCATAFEVVALRLPRRVAARTWPLGALASTPFLGGVMSACWLFAWLAVCTLGPGAIVRCSWDPGSGSTVLVWS